MTTPAALKRLLQRRVRGVNAVEVRTTAPFRAQVQIRPEKDTSFDALRASVIATLDDEGAAGVSYDVVPFPIAPPATEPVSSSLYLASFSSDQTAIGLKETLVGAVPRLGRLVFEETPGKGVRILVAEADGRSGPVLVQQVRSTLSAVGYAGLPFTVEQLPVGDPRNHLVNAGFSLPRRDSDVVSLTEEDDSRYSTRIKKLVEGGEASRVHIVDDHVGAKLLTTTAYQPPLPLPCLLPFYDRVFVQMPVWEGSGDDYFQRNFGTKESDFLDYCRAERVIPIFKFNLGLYPRTVIEPWLRDLGLPFLSPREFDYVAMRHIWKTSPHLQQLRDDPDLAIQISATLRSAMRNAAGSSAVQAVVNILSWSLAGAEAFEGIAWHKGQRALGNLCPAGPLLASMLFDKTLPDYLALEAFGVSINVATAQAFDASLTDGMVLNESLFDLILPFFQRAPEALSPTRTKLLGTLIESLELHYSGRIPAKEYLDILDLAETRRIREIANKLLCGGEDGVQLLELRERVQLLNNEVKKIEKNSIEKAGVDVIGDLAKVGGAASATNPPMALGAKLIGDLLQVGALKKAGEILFEKIVDDTKLGDGLDRLRGTINRVSPEAIRIYRIRKKLSK